MKRKIPIRLFIQASFLLLTLPVLYLGAESSVSKTLPKFSKEGYERLKENLQIVKTNIKSIQLNLTKIGKNIDSLERELLNIDELETENRELKKSYEDFLKRAKKEKAKNVGAKSKLQKWRERILSSDQKDEAKAVTALEQAENELTERQQWETEASRNEGRAKELITSLERNFTLLDDRRKGVQQELERWLGKRTQYEARLEESKVTMLNYQKLMANSPYF